ALAACDAAPDYILLVGDDQPGQEDQPWHLPAPRRKQHYWRAGEAPVYAADSLRGETDDDGLPDIPVGRLPVRTPKQLALVVEKIILWERPPPGPSDMRMVVWACDPAFGPLAKLFATSMALGQIETRSPDWLQPWVLSADPASAFCGKPTAQPRQFGQTLADGAGLGVIMAHASSKRIYVMRHRGQPIVCLPRDAIGPADGGPLPPLLVIACHAGNFTQAEPSFAETLLLAPRGPVALVAATAESHPLPNVYTGQALLDALADRPQRLGDLWLSCVRAASQKRSFLYEAVLKRMEAQRGIQTDPAKLLRDHPLLYALLGDPATRLPLPGPLKATLRQTRNGWRWRVETDNRPVDARTLMVQFRSAARKAPPADAPEPLTPEALAAANATYAFTTQRIMAAGEEWTGTVDAPGTLRLVAIGPKAMYARAFVLKTTDPSTAAHIPAKQD
ncbi:MAG: hypothetical protein KGY81_02725, partial [Phycisphaerae bacterium]|nr:hypothetical protein [Phycisphaerae bacterium]